MIAHGRVQNGVIGEPRHPRSAVDSRSSGKPNAFGSHRFASRDRWVPRGRRRAAHAFCHARSATGWARLLRRRFARVGCCEPLHIDDRASSLAAPANETTQLGLHSNRIRPTPLRPALASEPLTYRNAACAAALPRNQRREQRGAALTSELARLRLLEHATEVAHRVHPIRSIHTKPVQDGSQVLRDCPTHVPPPRPVQSNRHVAERACAAQCDFSVGPLLDSVGSVAEHEMQVVAHNGITAHLNSEESGEGA